MNIVLLNPEIPFNTGNIGRTCVATATTLHLVGKLGFRLLDLFAGDNAQARTFCGSLILVV